MISLSDISDAELMLIDHFCVRNILDAPSMQIIPLYRLMIEIAFMSNDKTGYANALRKAYNHLQIGKYRMTNEFDNLILTEIRKDKLIKLNEIQKI